MQLSHLDIVSHDDISKQKGVCKKCSSVCDVTTVETICLLHYGMFILWWSVSVMLEYFPVGVLYFMIEYFLVDCKLSLLVRELQWYHVTFTEIYETKWFGSNVWPTEDGWVFLHSGGILPLSEDVIQRGKCVGIFLSPGVVKC